MKDKATTDKGGDEKPPVVDAPDADTQPTSFPVDFNTWRASKRATRRVLLAGMAVRVRKAGELLLKLPAEQWEARFQKFMAA